LTRVRVAAGLVAAAALILAVGALGVEHDWWRLAHPDRARWPRWGVDVSHHQGAIDWRRVARDRQRVSFAYVKATEGGDFTDARFAENWAAARAAGLRVGAYHFFTFCRPAREQAAHFLSIVPRDADALPPAVDVEYGGNCKAPVARDAVVASLREWIALVRAATGRTPVVYATRDAYDDLLRDARLDAPLWLRSLVREPDVPAALWQFAHRARVDGITGPVDLDAAAPEVFAR
jgi:lysozyme